MNLNQHCSTLRPDERAVRLKDLRESVSLTQGELAARSGLSEVTISRLERGRNAPRESTIQKLAAALGVPARELFRQETTRRQVRA